MTNRYVYVSNRDGGNISGYRVNPNWMVGPGAGGLTKLHGSPYWNYAEPQPRGLAVAVVAGDASRMLYVASKNVVTMHPLSSTRGDVGQGANPGFVQAGTDAYGIAVDPTSTFAYVTNALSNDVSMYRIGPIGNLVPLSVTFPKTEANPAGIVVHPDGSFVYVANSGSTTISGFEKSPDGALAELAGSPFKSGQAPLSLAVDPSGEFLYVVNYNEDHDHVSQFRIQAGGALVPIQAPVLAAPKPTAIAVHPNGKFVYVTSENPGDVPQIYQYTIAEDGSLTMQTSHWTDDTPKSIAIDTTGEHFYVACLGANIVDVYSIDRNNGSFKPVSTAKTGSSPFSILVVA